MTRIFAFLSGIAVLMILIVGAGIYWLSSSDVSQARRDAANSVTKAIALSLSAQIELRNKTLDKMAQDPEVLAAVSSANPALLTSVAARLDQHFPDVLKIRLLLPGVSELDEKSLPRMGYADLDMVRQTFSKQQPAAIQGDEGPDRHLAIARQIKQNNQVVGVVLASLRYDFITQILQAANTDDGYLELKQAKLALGSSGNQAQQPDLIQLAVPNTDWELHYSYTESGSVGDLVTVSGIIFIPSLLAVLAFFAGHRKISELLEDDLSSVLKAFKDMMSNKLQGNYPVRLNEMNAVISTLVQFKRVLDHDENDTSFLVNESDDDDDLELSGFFDQPDEVSFSNQPSSDNYHVSEPDIDHDEPLELTTTAPAVTSGRSSGIYRAYDIRGIVGHTLTKEIVYDLGRALGTSAREQGCKTMVVGRDGRTSSPTFAESLAKGIASVGCNVLDIGMVPTPVLYFVTQHTDGRCGVMVTGSHNPAEYNGLKMVINGETLAGDSIQQLKLCIERQAFANGGHGNIEHNTRIVNEYIGTISEDVHINRPMLVVLDCGNGVAGELGPVLLRTLGCEVVELFCEVDGSFPHHHPDPSRPENLAELISAVKHYNADIGLAFDGDGDRLGVVDSNGKIIWPDRQMMLFAKEVLAGKPGAEIIFDVKCSRHLPEQIKKFGGRPLMWKTGHSFMKAKIKETGAKLAGEMSGHIFFNDRWFGFDDALYAAARLVEILSRDTRNSAEIFAGFPDSINTPELTVLLTEGENFKFIENMFAKAHFSDGKITNIDGMRVDFANGWGLVRASNTTPSLVIRFEADSNEAMQDIQNQFRQLMKQIKPNINLPF